MYREAQRLLHTDTEKGLAAQRLAKQADSTILQIAVEVDEDVAAGNQLDFRKHAIGGKAMIREYDVAPEGLGENLPDHSGLVVLDQSAFALV